jgi:hypothetical protein
MRRDKLVLYLHPETGPESSVEGVSEDSNGEAETDQLDKRQLDWILLSEEHKRIAIFELMLTCVAHQMRIMPNCLLLPCESNRHTVFSWKPKVTTPNKDGLSTSSCGWWGFGGSHVESRLKFLDIQRKHWLVGIELQACLCSSVSLSPQGTLRGSFRTCQACPGPRQ